MHFIELSESITSLDLFNIFLSEPGNSLGIGLGKRNPSAQQSQGIFVQCVIQGTPAANDGRLR